MVKVSIVACSVLLVTACGVVQHEQLNGQLREKKRASLAAMAECRAATEDPALDPIRRKVELYRDSFMSPPPFEIATNNSFPTDEERAAIALWAAGRDRCLKNAAANLSPPTAATPLQAAFFTQDVGFIREINANVGALIVALYQQKLTYGEFAQRRYEISRDGGAAELAFRQSELERDQAMQAEARERAQQQFASSLNAWSAYMQAVQARQPQTVVVTGTLHVN